MFITSYHFANKFVSVKRILRGGNGKCIIISDACLWCRSGLTKKLIKIIALSDACIMFCILQIFMM